MVEKEAGSPNAGALRSAPSSSRAPIPRAPWLANPGQAPARHAGAESPAPTEQSQAGLAAGVPRANASSGAHARGQQLLTLRLGRDRAESRAQRLGSWTECGSKRLALPCEGGCC